MRGFLWLPLLVSAAALGQVETARPPISRDELIRLLPSPEELIGLTRPADFGGNVLVWSSRDAPDRVELPDTSRPAPTIGSPHAAATRVFFTPNHLYRVSVRIDICESFDAAEAKIKQFVASTKYKLEMPKYPDTLVSHIDARYRMTGPRQERGFVFQDHAVFVLITGGPTEIGERRGMNSALGHEFFEAIALNIYLKAGRARKYTGMAVFDSGKIVVNGHEMASKPLFFRILPYVDVREAAGLLGAIFEWDPRNGELMLARPAVDSPRRAPRDEEMRTHGQGRAPGRGTNAPTSPARIRVRPRSRDFVLHAASNRTQWDATDKPAPTRCPVLKVGDAPWMTLGELCDLLNCRVEQKGQVFTVTSGW